MDCMELLDLIKKGEDSTLQFKKEFNSIDALAAEICAFANTKGGRIVIGVSDTGEITGVHDLNRLNQWISNAASQKIDPPVEVTTQNLLCEGKLVVLVDVPLGPNKPYAVQKTEFWLKVGADKRRATREELRRLMQASGGLYADEMPIMRAHIDDIDMDRFRRFYEQEYGMSLIDDEEAYRALLNLKLMQGPHPTLAGLLLFGNKPERLRPQFIVKAVAFVGTEIAGREYLDSEDITGTLYDQYRDTMAFLKRNLRKVQRGRDVNLPGVWEIPQIALEEAVVNALVHRDYFMNASVKIIIFDDHVEIISPGKLPNTVSIHTIKQGIQIARNPILLSFVPKLRIPYRGIGSGIRRMIFECRQAGLPEPEFIEDESKEEFKVIFARIAQ